jgi:chromosome segregation ATPase
VSFIPAVCAQWAKLLEYSQKNLHKTLDKYEKVSKDHKILTAKHNELRKDKEEMEARLSQYKQKLDELQSQDSANEAEIARWKRAYSAAQAALGSKKIQVFQMKKTINYLNNQTSELEASLATAKNDLKVATAEYEAALKKQQDNLAPTLALAMQKNTPTLREDIHHLRRKVLPFGNIGSTQTMAASTLMWAIAALAIIGRIE